MSAAIMALVPFLRSYGFVFAPTISSDVSNYNLRSAAVAAGWNQTAPLIATVTINSGIVVSATATGNYAFDTGISFPTGSTLALINNGFIIGMGGVGGNWGSSAASLNGGPALRAQHVLSITNSGTIGGGGGGGAGYGTFSSNAGRGGGGRTGRTNSGGGNPGTFSAGGSGASGSGGNYVGGYGGTWGASGDLGGGYGGGTQYGPGAGGAAVVGNSFITWVSTGTRYGSIT